MQWEALFHTLPDISSANRVGGLRDREILGIRWPLSGPKWDAEGGPQSTGQMAISGRMSMRRIWAATPKSAPFSSTRTMVAWQHTQHFSPEVNSGGRIRTSSTSVPFSILALVYMNTPLALTSRVSAAW